MPLNLCLIKHGVCFKIQVTFTPPIKNMIMCSVVRAVPRPWWIWGFWARLVSAEYAQGCNYKVWSQPQKISNNRSCINTSFQSYTYPRTDASRKCQRTTQFPSGWLCCNFLHESAFLLKKTPKQYIKVQTWVSNTIRLQFLFWAIDINKSLN